MSLYSIHALEYCYVSKYPKSAVIYGAHNEGTIKLPYCYMLIRGKGITALVDVGLNRTDYGNYLADSYGVENWHSPKEVLGEVGVRPEDITHVFVTHAHFDHIGNLESFPKAKVYLQKRELEGWIWAMGLPDKMRWLMGGVDPGDMILCVELSRDQRLVLVDGDAEDVLPGIDITAALDSHTFASMWVTVRNNGAKNTDDAWVMAGDLIYQFENVEGKDSVQKIDSLYIPIGFATGSQLNSLLATDKMMKQVGQQATHIIAGHEERVGQRFPSRTTKLGLRISEIALADGAKSVIK
jgi:glyoxylase-like metal-dependent hydrolase (beta-lactamase superfamily II)